MILFQISYQLLFISGIVQSAPLKYYYCLTQFKQEKGKKCISNKAFCVQLLLVYADDKIKKFTLWKIVG